MADLADIGLDSMYVSCVPGGGGCPWDVEKHTETDRKHTLGPYGEIDRGTSKG